MTAEMIYERRWALTVLERVLSRLKDEYLAADNAALFDSLKELLPDEPGSPSQAAIAARLGMTENAVRQAFYRFRQRYQRYCERRLPTPLRHPATSKTSSAISSLYWRRNVWRNFTEYQRGVPQASPSMIRVIRICRKCGAKIFSDVPEGLCPSCVLKNALGDFRRMHL